MSTTPNRALAKMRHNNAARQNDVLVRCEQCDGRGFRDDLHQGERCMACDGHGRTSRAKGDSDVG